MALTKRKKDEKTTKEFYKFTGVIPMKLKAYNPTLKEQQEMGLNFKEESEYFTDDDMNKGSKQYKATFWLTNAETQAVNNQGKPVTMKEGELLVPLTYYISQVDQVTRDGSKYKFINKYGKGIFAASKEDIPEWFNDADSVRVSKRGEEELMRFLFAFANLKAPSKDAEGDENVLEDPNKIFEGDESELTDIAEFLMKEGNVVRCLVGLKGKDSDKGMNVNEVIYRDFFLKISQKSPIPFKSYINASKVNEDNRADQRERREFKADYYTFEPTKLLADEATEKVQTHMDKPDSDEGSENNVPVGEEEEAF